LVLCSERESRVPDRNDRGPDIAGFIWHDTDDAPAIPIWTDGGFNLKESFGCKFAAGEKLLIVGSTICCWSAATLFQLGLLSQAAAGIRPASIRMLTCPS
jgi:hypothetical protein